MLLRIIYKKGFYWRFVATKMILFSWNNEQYYFGLAFVFDIVMRKTEYKNEKNLIPTSGYSFIKYCLLLTICFLI